MIALIAFAAAMLIGAALVALQPEPINDENASKRAAAVTVAALATFLLVVFALATYAPASDGDDRAGHAHGPAWPTSYRHHYWEGN